MRDPAKMCGNVMSYIYMAFIGPSDNFFANARCSDFAPRAAPQVTLLKTN
jgi:hypothetical protein